MLSSGHWMDNPFGYESICVKWKKKWIKNGSKNNNIGAFIKEQQPIAMYLNTGKASAHSVWSNRSKNQQQCIKANGLLWLEFWKGMQTYCIDIPLSRIKMHLREYNVNTHIQSYAAFRNILLFVLFFFLFLNYYSWCNANAKAKQKPSEMRKTKEHKWVVCLFVFFLRFSMWLKSKGSARSSCANPIQPLTKQVN